ncbi:Uncharacterized protein FWK35_00017509 [Aphis craccivora]|uniref:MULE domain-containing protein n=1 Tax=Aphis craccivora TaxID=307492 RepID=A0A6G0YQS3_APHCR|nr:Uncharacterized protein FWK35_00017509 [Aphis craccivora]
MTLIHKLLNIVGIHNAILFVWPSTNIIGCRLHLTQAWYRKIQELGLSTEYKENCCLGLHLD